MLRRACRPACGALQLSVVGALERLVIAIVDLLVAWLTWAPRLLTLARRDALVSPLSGSASIAVRRQFVEDMTTFGRDETLRTFACG